MLPEDQIRFLENFHWFNLFFRDVRQLIDEIHNTLKSELGFRILNRGWYYGKSNHMPSLPPYWLRASSEVGFALQIFLVLDTSMLEAHPFFTNDLSLIFVKHDRSDRLLYPDDYGLRVIKNKDITHNIFEHKHISGEIIRSQGVSNKYQAFQVPLSAFTVGKDIHQVIMDEIVSVFKELPSWESDKS
jgi:hypothetical protein